MRIEIGIAIKNYALWLFVRGIEKKMQAPGLVIRGRIRLRIEIGLVIKNYALLLCVRRIEKKICASSWSSYERQDKIKD